MKKPVVLIIMDGVGITEEKHGNAFLNAYTPTLDHLMYNYPNIQIKAHGLAVGLPSDADMGNSEVGHNALGCGQIYAQGAKLVNQSIEDGSIYESSTWKTLIGNALEHKSTVHFIGLLSDGNVHAHINHLKALIKRSKENGVKRVRCHILLDGRDVDATSALKYVDELEGFLADLNDLDFDAKIASGGGRMKITMDRYEANWNMVKLGYETHVLGKAKAFKSATEAITTYRNELHCNDQDLPAFVITNENEPVGTIEDNDSVILFNFRGDRAIELCKAFEDDEFPYFDRIRRPKVLFAGMLQYDGDLKIPTRYLVNPPHIEHSLTEMLVKNGINEYALSETQKYGHVTYFWNGNRSEKVDEGLETYEEILSDTIPFEQRPWMKSAEITDHLIAALKSGKYDFLRLNFPNGDMVGHTGNYEAAVIACETVDLQLARIIEAIDATSATLIVTADHGNVEEMFEKGTSKPKTSHTLNPVPFIIYDKDTKYSLKKGNFGLANVASTIVELLGLKPLEVWEESMLE